MLKESKIIMSPLKPIKQQKVSDQVFEQLKELIFRGRLKPGEKMNPERDMATTMNVSRTTIRNALGRLITMGLVEHKQGQGTFVSTPDPQKGNPFAMVMKAQETTIYDLLDVRMGLECVAAALAAERADANDIKALMQSIEQMENHFHNNRAVYFLIRAIGYAGRHIFSYGNCLCHKKSTPYSGDEKFS